MLSTSHVSASVERLYVEEVDGYFRVDGETLRWDEKREFAINDYDLYEVSVNNSIQKFVNISMTDDSNYGVVHNVNQRVERVNFIPTVEYTQNGSLKNIEWDVRLFRIAEGFREPFDNQIATLLSDNSRDHRRFDLFTEPTYFSVALEYYEFQMVEGELQKLRVNTELTTDNDDDGLIHRTALHIIKRMPDGETIFDLSYSVKEADNLYRITNLIDQPYLIVPAQIGAVLLMVFIYIKISNYWRKNNYRIVKGEQDESETSEEDRKD